MTRFLNTSSPMKILWLVALVSVSPASAAKVIGIDLGTTYSCVAVYEDGRVVIMANEQGNRITPSVVAFTESMRLIGDPAKNQMASNPTNTIFGAKRILGRDFTEKSVQQDMKMWPFKVVSRDNKPMFEVQFKGETKLFAPEEISAMVLSKMKHVAATYLNRNVTDAVVTVPAYFNDAQRQATKDAGRIAGLNVVRTISEPTAASLAYGLHKKNSKEMNVLVFDLGGGTFDVSLLTMDDGVFEVLATSGDAHLGGEDFDERVMAHLIKTFKKKNGGVDLRRSERALSKLRREVEKAKRALSSVTQVRVEVENIMNGLDLSETVSRARFEELNSDLFRKTLKSVRMVLEDAKMKKSEVDEIVLVGGSTRIPKVQELIRDFFNGKSPNRGVNPDEAVAYGAAVQAAMMSGEADADGLGGVVIDVLPLSVGIKTVGDVMAKVVERNTNIPVSKTQVFTTYQDEQTAVSIEVYQGERASTKDNILLGKFEVSGIPPAPRGVPQIEVKFDVDTDGILHVSAREVKSGREGSISITKERHGQLSEEEIDAMIRDAKANEEADAHLVKVVEVKNRLEGKVFWVERELRDGDGDEESGLSGGISEEEKETLVEAVQEAKEWLDRHGDTADLEELEEKLREFDAVTEPILKEVAKGRSGEPPKTNGWEEEGEEDHVGL